MEHGKRAATAVTAAAIKIYFYKMMRTHNEFRRIFGFLLLMFLVEWNPMKTCSIHEIGKKNTNESHHSTHTHTPHRTVSHRTVSHRKGGDGSSGGKGRLISSLDFQLAIFISYRRAILRPLLITKTNKYRSKFIVVVSLSFCLPFSLSGCMRVPVYMYVYLVACGFTCRLW